MITDIYCAVTKAYYSPSFVLTLNKAVSVLKQFKSTILQ